MLVNTMVGAGLSKETNTLSYPQGSTMFLDFDRIDPLT